VVHGIEAKNIFKIGLILGMLIVIDKMANSDNRLRYRRFSEGNFLKGDTLLK